MRCSGNSSNFNYLHELYCNELVFILSQVCLFRHHRCRNCRTIYPPVLKICLLFFWFNQNFSSLLSRSSTKTEENISIVFRFLLTFAPRWILYAVARGLALRVCLLIRKVKVHSQKMFLDLLFPCCWLLRHLWSASFCEKCWLSICALGVSKRLK